MMATEEQSKIVERILKSKSLYDCLSVKKDASSQDIVKQFKKLSILVHPDRNPHPNSSDAFKKINEAKMILTDETKRKYYDMTGSTSYNFDRPRHHHHFSTDKHYVFYNTNNRFFTTDEELFQFFSNPEFFTFQRRPFRSQHFNPTYVFNTRPRRERQRSDEDSEFKTLLPLIILFLFFMVYNLV